MTARFDGLEFTAVALDAAVRFLMETPLPTPRDDIEDVWPPRADGLSDLAVLQRWIATLTWGFAKALATIEAETGAGAWPAAGEGLDWRSVQTLVLDAAEVGCAQARRQVGYGEIANRKGLKHEIRRFVQSVESGDAPSTRAALASRLGVSEATLYRWLHVGGSGVHQRG